MVRLPATNNRIVWRDITDSESTSDISRHSMEDVTASHDAVTSLCTRLQRVSGCIIAEYTTTWFYHLTDSFPINSSLVHDSAIFVFDTDTDTEFVLAEVHGISSLIYKIDGIIDMTNPDIVDIADNIISSGYCNPFGFIALHILFVV